MVSILIYCIFIVILGFSETFTWRWVWMWLGIIIAIIWLMIDCCCFRIREKQESTWRPILQRITMLSDVQAVSLHDFRSHLQWALWWKIEVLMKLVYLNQNLVLGRLLRRMSSSEESPNATMQPQQNFDATTGGIRRGSITEAVQQQYVITKPPKQVLRPDSESHLFT